jgi:hypothetical protein
VDVTLTSNLAIAVLGVVAAWVQTRRNQGGGRDQVRRDVELFNILPQESTSRNELLVHIDGQITRLVRSEQELTRDPSGVVLAIFIMLVAIALTVTAFREGGYWWLLFVPAFFFGILGSVGLGQDLPLRKRDERGRIIKEAPDSNGIAGDMSSSQVK